MHVKTVIYMHEKSCQSWFLRTYIVPIAGQQALLKMPCECARQGSEGQHIRMLHLSS